MDSRTVPGNRWPRLLKRVSPGLFVGLALFLSFPARAGQRLDLTLLHTNDIHGHMLPYDYGDQSNVGGAARRAAAWMKANMLKSPCIYSSNRCPIWRCSRI